MDFFNRINTKYPWFFQKYVRFRLNHKIKRDYSPNDFCYDLHQNDITNWKDKFYKYFKDKKIEYNNHGISMGKELLPHGVFSWYVGYFSNNINGYLRQEDEKKEDNKVITDRIQVMLTELNREEFKLEKDIVVVREIQNRHFERKLKVGDKIVDKGFLSASLDLLFRKRDEMNQSVFNNTTLIFLKVYAGTSAMYLEPVSQRNEFEILLPNSLEIEIEDIYWFLSNRIIFAKANPNKK